MTQVKKESVSEILLYKTNDILRFSQENSKNISEYLKNCLNSACGILDVSFKRYNESIENEEVKISFTCLMLDDLKSIILKNLGYESIG